MSRVTIFSDNRLEVIAGDDIVLGKFYQIFDKKMRDETQEGEGLVYDWSEYLGTEVNYTSLPDSLSPEKIIYNYITDVLAEENNNINFVFSNN